MLEDPKEAITSIRETATWDSCEIILLSRQPFSYLYPEITVIITSAERKTGVLNEGAVASRMTQPSKILYQVVGSTRSKGPVSFPTSNASLKR